MLRNAENNRADQQRWREKHRETDRSKSAKRYADNAVAIRKIKDQPCADCGKTYPYFVMDFDHRGDKDRSVSKMMTRSLAKILAEIEKCDLVCANCHRVRTFRGSQEVKAVVS